MADSKFTVGDGLTLNDVSALFKIKYEKLSENVYNSANVLLGRVKKSYNFTGRKLQISIPQSFSGGVGSGKLPKANAARYVAAEITAKKVYAVVDVDRETIKAALSDEGSFVRATKEVVKKGVESYMRNMSRILFNDGSGKLGTIDASLSAALSSQGTAAEPIVAISAESFKEANLEEKDLVNIGSGSTSDNSLFEIIEVDVAAQTVKLSRLAGSQDLSALTASDSDLDMFMQNSEGKDPMGLKGALVKHDPANPSQLYTVDVARRWSAEVKDVSATSDVISTDLLNEMMLKIKKKSGKSPNLIVCSYKQYEIILSILEDKKQFNVNTRAGLKTKSGADISFSGVEFMSIDGAVGIFPERFVEDDRIYFLNDSHIEIYHRPDFGWFDDDGTVFLRKATEDEYEARYGGYMEVYVNPCFHGVIHGLATSRPAV
jgi:D-arabinose 5-phosphate isomerase GutQ